MVKIVRTLKYMNGSIEISTSLNEIYFVCVKGQKIMETKGLPLSSCGNRQIVDGIIVSLKDDAELGILQSDATVVFSKGFRYIIGGMLFGCHILYGKEHSRYYKQAFLPYNYAWLSLKDYYIIFPE